MRIHSVADELYLSGGDFVLDVRMHRDRDGAVVLLPFLDDLVSGGVGLRVTRLQVAQHRARSLRHPGGAAHGDDGLRLIRVMVRVVPAEDLGISEDEIPY